MKHKLECYHNAYEHYKDEAYVFAGPACMETFGEIPFLPENKEENLKLSKKAARAFCRIPDQSV